RTGTRLPGDICFEPKKDSKEEAMPNHNLSVLRLTTATAAAAIALAIALPAASQERKSIRWSTSSVDSYGYKVAALMTKVVEEALGGEYTVTVNPYPSTTGAMKAAMDGDGEIGYTADVGMTQLYEGSGGFKD